MNEDFIAPILPAPPEVVYDPRMWDRNQYARDYVVLTALRGPDVPCTLGSVLKSIITRRLRAIVFTSGECQGDYADTPIQYQQLTELEYYLRDLGIRTLGTAPKLTHFVAHLHDALAVTRDHPIWRGHADEICGLLRNMLHEFAKHEYSSRYGDGRQ